MRPQTRRLPSLAAIAAPALLATSALAVFTADLAPTWRGAAETEYGYWESFTSEYLGENVPDDLNSTTGAVLVQTVPGAFLTTGGNIYSPSAAMEFELRDELDCDLQELWLQVSTWGSTLDPASVRLEFTDCLGATAVAGAPTMSVLASYPNPGGLGVNEELLFEWDLSGEGADLRAYTVFFDAAAPSLSLDAVILDARTDCASLDSCELGSAYCFGDGSGNPCPCGNAGAAGNGCANSASPDGARLSAFGAASVSAGDLVLRGSGLVGSQPGLFFQGQNALGGATFGDGLRCAGGGVVRIQTVTPTAGEASSTIDVAARGGVSAGDTRYYQLWYRDPVNGPCGSGQNLSNGLELVWQP